MGQLIESAFGGGLIGAAAAGLLLLGGRIAGVSGILGNVLAGARDPWRGAFLLGLIAAVFVAPLAGLPAPNPTLAGPAWSYGVGGLLVGFGTRIGSGCTSGHGVCGLSNFSLRSLTATLLFMASACLTVFLVRHVAG
jgi:uncharacterized membrane protein YedE/YeeE